MRFLPLLLLLNVGCNAIFTDLSPSENMQGFDAGSPGMDAMAGLDSGPGTDTGPGADAGPRVDAGGLDAGPAQDSGPPGIDAGGSASPVLLGSGTFDGRGGYPAAGSVRLEQVGAGAYQVVMSDDFSSAAVPGPVVVVTPRPAIGRALAGEDIVVTSLNASQIAGPNTFPFSAASVPDDAFVFVYCEPFGVETARAELSR